jgi:ADP-ribose pyrophosphatase
MATGLEQGEAAPEEDEYLKPVRMPFHQALEMVHNGDITDAKTMLALMLAEKHLS